MVVWEDPAIIDKSGDVLHVACDPQSGTNFTIGQTTVICEAVNKSANKAVCFFQVIVTGAVVLRYLRTWLEEYSHILRLYAIVNILERLMHWKLECLK